MPAEQHGNQPFVSILSPSFNQGRFIRDCLVSVSNQTYKNIEHIVCDGGSTDQTLEHLTNAAPLVQWVSEPDRGQAHALNKAFAMSTGDIIGWINSDDALFATNTVETVVTLLDQWPDVD